MKLTSKVRLLVFPCCSLLLLSLIIINNFSIFNNRESITFTYIKNLAQGNIAYGDSTKSGNTVSWQNLKPGDILLGGWPNCSYGRFSHTGLFLGNNKVLESYIDSGITINSLRHYRDYPQICIIRVNTTEDIKNMAIAYAIKQEGKMFYPVAFKNGDRYWNCSKIIWKAYKNQGVDLDKTNDLWIAPDVFYRSPLVSIIAEEGEMKD